MHRGGSFCEKRQFGQRGCTDAHTISKQSGQYYNSHFQPSGHEPSHTSSQAGWPPYAHTKTKMGGEAPNICPVKVEESNEDHGIPMVKHSIILYVSVESCTFTVPRPKDFNYIPYCMCTFEILHFADLRPLIEAAWIYTSML